MNRYALYAAVTALVVFFTMAAAWYTVIKAPGGAVGFLLMLVTAHWTSVRVGVYAAASLKKSRSKKP